MSKEIVSPAIVHGQSEKAQGEWFQAECSKVARGAHTVQNGKGSRTRTNTNSKAWRSNYDSIFRKDK